MMTTVHDPLRGWAGSGLRAAIGQALDRSSGDDGAVMIDSNAMRIHAHGANLAGGQAAHTSRQRRSFGPNLPAKIRLASEALGCSPDTIWFALAPILFT